MHVILVLALVLLSIPTMASADGTTSRPVHDPNSENSQSAGEAYRIDDGSGEGAMGYITGLIVWLNQFTVVDGASHLTSIRMAGGVWPESSEITLVVFDDPNNDGDPSDIGPADLLYSGPALSGPDSDVFIEYPTPLIHLGRAGDSFFVGGCANHDHFEWPARLDQNTPLLRSWIAGGDAGSDCADPNDLTLPLNISETTSTGAWMVRATGTDPTPIGQHSWGSIKTTYR